MSFLFAISLNLMGHLVTSNSEYKLSNLHPNLRNNSAIFGNYTGNFTKEWRTSGDSGWCAIKAQRRERKDAEESANEGGVEKLINSSLGKVTKEGKTYRDVEEEEERKKV
ncbi:hypothetical protein PV325_011894 [Microctonus aethiopoides]|nr:hypothetical protein PV325_011894 [Microctonus aethiopoides]